MGITTYDFVVGEQKKARERIAQKRAKREAGRHAKAAAAKGGSASLARPGATPVQSSAVPVAARESEQANGDVDGSAVEMRERGEQDAEDADEEDELAAAADAAPSGCEVVIAAVNGTSLI